MLNQAGILWDNLAIRMGYMEIQTVFIENMKKYRKKAKLTQ